MYPPAWSLPNGKTAMGWMQSKVDKKTGLCFSVRAGSPGNSARTIPVGASCAILPATSVDPPRTIPVSGRTIFVGRGSSVDPSRTIPVSAVITVIVLGSDDSARSITIGYITAGFVSRKDDSTRSITVSDTLAVAVR